MMIAIVTGRANRRMYGGNHVVQREGALRTYASEERRISLDEVAGLRVESVRKESLRPCFRRQLIIRGYERVELRPWLPMW